MHLRSPVILLILVLTAGISLYGQKMALIIIDIQECYFPGGKLQLEDPELAGMNAGLLLNYFRKSDLPVYHVRHNTEPGGAIHSYVKPIEDEVVISKDQINAFLDTPLLEMLVADSVEQLLFCGMQTHLCVEAAVRAAHDLGFTCLLASDACATRALQYEEYIIPARNVQYSTLQTLQGNYARIVTTEEIIRELGQQKCKE